MTHKGTKRIETPRLILRMAQIEDAEPMFRNWASDPEVTKFLTWPAYQSIDSAYPVLNMWIRDYEKPDFYQWIIELKEISEPIGSITRTYISAKKIVHRHAIQIRKARNCFDTGNFFARFPLTYSGLRQTHFLSQLNSCQAGLQASFSESVCHVVTFFLL